MYKERPTLTTNNNYCCYNRSHPYGLKIVCTMLTGLLINCKTDGQYIGELQVIVIAENMILLKLM